MKASNDKHRMVLMVSETEFEKLRRAASREKMTIANYFRRALGLPLERQGFKMGTEIPEEG